MELTGLPPFHVAVSAAQVMQFMAWKAGMDMAVRHILQKDLPPYVRGGDAVRSGPLPAGPRAAAAPAPTAHAVAPPAGAAAAPAAPPAAAPAELGGPGAAAEARAPARPGAHGEAGGAMANGSARPPTGAGKAGQQGASGAAPATGAKRPRDEGAGAGADCGQGMNPNPGSQAPDGPGAAAALLAERAAKAQRLDSNPGGSVASAAQAAAPAAAPAALGGSAPNADVGRIILAVKPARGGSEDGESTSRAHSELALDDLGAHAQARAVAAWRATLASRV